jgi:hypothetical protein
MCVEVLLGLCLKMGQCPIVLKPYVMPNSQWHIFKYQWYNFSQKHTQNKASEMGDGSGMAHSHCCQ